MKITRETRRQEMGAVEVQPTTQATSTADTANELHVVNLYTQTRKQGGTTRRDNKSNDTHQIVQTELSQPINKETKTNVTNKSNITCILKH
jgi:hypothetical protein